VYNANPSRVTVVLPDSTFSIRACGTAELTLIGADSVWNTVSGADPADPASPKVSIHPWTPGNEQGGPRSFVDIIFPGPSVVDYPASDAPSLPPCSPVGTSAPPSG
jgi:hypothetical protein